MDSRSDAAESQDVHYINLFCAYVGEDGEEWRVHVAPACWLPRSLHACFDRHLESQPVPLDFEDLDRQMQKADAPYDKRVSKLGGVELTARGRAANVLARWLRTAFASGVRE